jgi:hypothetical protein
VGRSLSPVLALKEHGGRWRSVHGGSGAAGLGQPQQRQRYAAMCVFDGFFFSRIKSICTPLSKRTIKHIKKGKYIWRYICVVTYMQAKKLAGFFM